MTRGAVGVACLTALAGAATGWFGAALRPAPPPEAAPRRALSLALPADRTVLDIAIAPDASRIAYTAVVDGRTHLHLRRLDGFETEIVPGTAGARQPFFAPDGAAVGFFADGWLRTVADEPTERAENGAAGGGLADVCRVRGETAGGAWDAQGRIVFGGPGDAGLLEVPASGGEPAALTVIDRENGETAHGWPQVIDERWILFTTGREGRDPRLTLLDRTSGETRPLHLADGGGWFVEPSAVAFVRRGEIFASRLDLDSEGETAGIRSPRPVLRGAAGTAVGYRRRGRSQFAAARDGTLVFAPPADADNRLVRVDAGGRSRRIDDVAARHQTPRIAPDGRRAAVSAVSAVLRRDLWLIDLAAGSRRQLTSAAGDNHSPLWSPDGATLTFASSRTGLQRPFRLRLRDLEVSDALLGGDQRTPGSWSPDGRRLAFHELHPDHGRDIWTWTDDPDGAAAPWLATAANERAPAFSPDGRWIAYVSDAAPGEGDQVYLRPAPGAADAPAIRITPAGGTEPVWRKSGRALFFRRGPGLYRADVGADGRPLAAPEHLFDGAYIRDPLGNLPAYDIAPDGGDFLMLEPAGRVSLLHVLTGWQDAVFPLAPD